MDSELAMLPQLDQAPKRFGIVANPAYKQSEAKQISPANGVLMVARLDGPSADLAKRLVNRAVVAEKDGLWGRAYVDLRGLTDGPYKPGDDRLRRVAEITRRSGFTTVVDEQPATLPVGYPASQIAIYVGWYGINVEGVFAESTVEFMPGAIAYHLHSFNGSMIRDAHARWIGPFVRKGATATFGSVYEPYLELTPDQPLFFSRLIQDGFSFGEAGYAATRALSWQTVFVGDPLYRPFGRDPGKRCGRTWPTETALCWNGFTCWPSTRDSPPVLRPRRRSRTCDNCRNKKSAVLKGETWELLSADGQAESASEAFATAARLSTSPKQRQRLAAELARFQK
ncbi:MAG: hypothetical protein CM1200mP34_2260 [Verrucomicrobiales bacterium]|nr:MAG: hypothetical protein CM1200mP34_2260 [Verrucomicrobiales bacterium]